MKSIKFIIVAFLLLLAGLVKAQITVTVAPPPWGPAGYTNVRYYYLPDVEAYYDVQSSVFVYNNAGIWVRRTYLPARYKGYDLYGGYKVVMTDYRGNAPYTFFKDYKMKFPKGYRGSAQKNIGEKPGNGNMNANMSGNGKPMVKGKQGNVKSQGNDNKSMKQGHVNGGGKGKKK